MVCELYLYKAGEGVNLKKQVQIMTQKKKKKKAARKFLGESLLTEARNYLERF